MSKSIVISFRVQPAHLAKALDGLTSVDRSFIATKLSEIARQTFFHGIAYTTMAIPHTPTDHSLAIIKQMTAQNKKARQFDPDKIINQKPNFKQLDPAMKSTSSVPTDFDPKALMEDESDES